MRRLLAGSAIAVLLLSAIDSVQARPAAHCPSPERSKGLTVAQVDEILKAAPSGTLSIIDLFKMATPGCVFHNPRRDGPPEVSVFGFAVKSEAWSHKFLKTTLSHGWVIQAEVIEITDGVNGRL